MQSGEIVGTEQLAAITPADAARWLLAIVIVATLGAGLVTLAADWTPSADDLGPPAPPAILLELAPMPVPELEPIAEPIPEAAEPEVEPLPPEPEPEPVTEPTVEPAPEPLPPVEEPPEPVLPDEPPQEPEPLPAPLPEPAPVMDAEIPGAAMPVTMSTALQRQRQDTPATNFQPPRRPRSEPTPPPASNPPPRQAMPPSQPAANTGPTPEQWQQQVLRYLDRRKQYPRDAERAGQEGVVAISFTIDTSGRVLSASVARSSGFPALDQAALDTARRSSPVPRPPASLGGSVSLTASIRFTIR